MAGRERAEAPRRRNVGRDRLDDGPAVECIPSSHGGRGAGPRGRTGVSAKDKVTMLRLPDRRIWVRDHRVRDRASHRDDGPAIEMDDGNKYWIEDGLWHREDGPAAEIAPARYWFLRGAPALPDRLRRTTPGARARHRTSMSFAREGP